jgi:hypothetical protein
MTKRQASHPHLRYATVPSPEKLEIMFENWLSKRNNLPPFKSPASSGFYDEVFGGLGKTPTFVSSGFFDEEYNNGKRVVSPSFPLQSNLSNDERTNAWLQSSSGPVDTPLRLQSSSGPEAQEGTTPRLQTSSGPGVESTPYGMGTMEGSVNTPFESLITTSIMEGPPSDPSHQRPHLDYVIPAFEIGMHVAFCDSVAQASGSGKIVRIIKPGQRGNEYRSLLGAFDRNMEVLYEIENDTGMLPTLTKESTMWKISGTLQRNHPALNPAHRPILTSAGAFTGRLVSRAEIERHEKRIYQTGYTPKAIRESIQRMLQESNPNQHVIDFQERDIPPPDRDMQTHRTLNELLQLRTRLNQDFQSDTDSVAADGTPLDPNRNYMDAFAKRDADYNRVNRKMYSIYVASDYIIHDRNFSSYCRPTLRHLPEATAFKLTTLKNRLQPHNTDIPPYTTVQRPTTTQTQPVFQSSRPSFADVVRSPLRPRPQWMKDAPPIMSENEADKVWRQGVDNLFTSGKNTIEKLKSQVEKLQNQIAQQQHIERAMSAQPIESRTANASEQQLTSRIFRQGRKTYTADKNTDLTKTQSKLAKQALFGMNQSHGSIKNFCSSSAVPKTKKSPANRQQAKDLQRCRQNKHMLNPYKIKNRHQLFRLTSRMPLWINMPILAVKRQ